MSADLGLGQKITGTTKSRDAIHIAVVPVTVRAHLAPGQRVKLSKKGYAIPASDSGKDAIGVIDPYLIDFLHPGDQCWLFLMPGSITSLRHDWTHPAFPAPQLQVPTGKRIVSEDDELVDEMADLCGLSVKRLLGFAKNWITSGKHQYMGSNDNYNSCEKYHWDALWRVYEREIGFTKEDTAKPEHFFSCSC